MTINATLYAYYEDSTNKDGETGLTVTVDVWRITKSSYAASEVVTAGNATEIGDGLYCYVVSSADPTLYDYLAMFKTSASTVSSKHVPSLRIDYVETRVTEMGRIDENISAAKTLAAGAVTAAVIATGAIDADALATDAVTEIWAGSTAPAASAIADAVWDEALSGHTTAGTAGKALSDAGAAGDPWSATVRTLTSTAAQTLAAISGSDLVITRYLDYSATVTSMTISASWTKAYFTVKDNLAPADSNAVLQIVVSNPAAASTDGVLYVDGAAATAGQRTQGSLTVTQGSGTIAIALVDDLTAVLPEGNYTWDFKILTATTSAKPAGSGNVTISATETQSIA